MIQAGKPLQWIAHELGHVGVKKIDEVYGRWTRTPEEESLDLHAFFCKSCGSRKPLKRCTVCQTPVKP